MGPPSSWPLLLLGWAAGADLATMAPVYCPPHAARTRGRELCPTDADLRGEREALRGRGAPRAAARRRVTARRRLPELGLARHGGLLLPGHGGVAAVPSSSPGTSTSSRPWKRVATR